MKILPRKSPLFAPSKLLPGPTLPVRFVRCFQKVMAPRWASQLELTKAKDPSLKKRSDPPTPSLLCVPTRLLLALIKPLRGLLTSEVVTAPALAALPLSHNGLSTTTRAAAPLPTVNMPPLPRLSFAVEPNKLLLASSTPVGSVPLVLKKVSADLPPS